MSTETPLDLKKTINLPKTGFAQKANLAQSEPARLKKWSQIGLYEKIRRAREGAEKFILHDGPPYANADIHLGTAMNKILKDFIVKSRTMMSYDAPYVPGYDCHGLPIELYVERKLGAKKANMPPVSIRRACREHASEALKRQTRDFQRLGILGDWDNPYLTMSNHYEAETARLFGRFVELLDVDGLVGFSAASAQAPFALARLAAFDCRRRLDADRFVLVVFSALERGFRIETIERGDDLVLERDAGLNLAA